MSMLLQTVLPYVLVYKYAALFLLTYFAAIALPLPSGPATIAAAAFASQGYMNIGWVIVAAVAGNIGGDITGYWLARIYGKPVLYKIGLRRILESGAFRLLEREVKTYRTPIIFLTRFQVQATNIINTIAGLSKMDFRKFIFYASAGETTEVLMYAAVGYLFGSNWQAISNLLGEFTLALVLLAALALILLSRKFSDGIINKMRQRNDIGIEDKN